METPFFIIKEKILNKNIEDFENALKSDWPNSQLSYSVKTNSLPWLLKYMHSKGVYAEVVSDEEYDLAKDCGYREDEIIFNGPIKGEETLKNALSGFSIVNLDSKHDVEMVCEWKKKTKDNLGLRINLNPDLFNSKDIGYEQEGFRFGFSDETSELDDIVMRLKETYPNLNWGLHLHCNSVTRSVEVYKTIAKFAASIIRKYDLKPPYIDIGGGFFGGVEGKPTAKEYISVIKTELNKTVDITKTKLILEPGSAIIGSAVDLVTTVLDVKDTAKARIVTTDGSRIHIDPLWKKKSYMYSLETKSKNILKQQVICGYTCMDHDRLMRLENEKELVRGDTVIYHRVGAYSMTFGGAFIRYYPEVYVDIENELEKVRKKMTVNEYVKMHSIWEEV